MPYDYEITPISSSYSKEMLSAVADFVMAFAMSETVILFCLDSMIWKSERPKATSFLALHGTPVSAMLTKITRLSRKMDIEKSDEIKKTCRRLRKLFDQRNAIVHGIPGMSKDDIYTGFSIDAAGLYVEYTKDDILGLSREVEQQCRHLNKLLADCGMSLKQY